jgi:hypothetical protein
LALDRSVAAESFGSDELSVGMAVVAIDAVRMQLLQQVDAA